jgi:hypothetical protein
MSHRDALSAEQLKKDKTEAIVTTDNNQLQIKESLGSLFFYFRLPK